MKAHEWAFKQPIKGTIARRFYDHDGSLGGGLITIGAEELPWFEGLYAGSIGDDKDRRSLLKIIECLRAGGTIDMWFDV